MYIYNATVATINDPDLNNYNEYSSEDFLLDEDFVKWVKSGGNEGALFFETVRTQFPDKISELMLAKSIYYSLHTIQENPDSGTKAKIWINVEDAIGEDQPEEQADHPVRLLQIWWRVAAILVIAGGLSWLAKSTFMRVPVVYQKQVAQAEVKLDEKINADKSPQTISLSDGSTVRLVSGSKLSYSDFSGAQRVVYLDGEGYFDVAKDTSKPFVVYAGQIKVLVLGTSFKVVSHTGQYRSNVTVTAGKVKVSAVDKNSKMMDGQEDEIFLTPNQQVVFDAKKRSFSKGLVAQPVQLAGVAAEFDFTNTTIKHVLSTIATAYGVTIRFENTAFESCLFTAPLDDMPLFRKLDIICQTVGATYEVFGTEIIISGGECSI